MISPTVLQEILPEGPEELDGFKYEKLRDAYTAYKALPKDDSGKLKNDEGRRKWLDAIFESLLGYDGSWWQKEQHVSRRFKTESITKEILRPNRVLLFNKYEEYPRFLLRIDKDSKRIGMGRGRTVYGKLLELLRGTGNRIGILTNGDQIRLVYAGLDHDSWVDWEVERWFEDSEGKEELLGFISLYGHTRTDRIEGDDYPLLSTILRSREKQGELSQVLGEQTREAVETLLKAVDRASRTKPELIDVLRINPETGSEISESDRLDAIYQSSIRFVMRVVITLFAESRELLPKSNETYHGSYGVEGLFAQLNQAAAAEGMESLEDRYYAWPRLLSLFRLIHEGSSYSELPIHEYGGALFRRGDIKSSDNVSKALSIFEDESAEISDATVLKMLKLLKIGKLKAKRGRSSTWVSGVVDFSDLRTEYIGMMYEGLLDYNLRIVSEDQEAVLFLNIGQEPALPFSLLKNLDEKGIKDLIGKLSKEKSSDLDIPDIESEEELIDQIEEESEEEVEEKTPDIQLTPQQEKYLEILEWAENAVQLAGLVKKSKGKKFNKFRYEKDVYNAAVKLIKRDIYPGQMYLVRASGTRKGTGTFYTKPGLAVPTVHRTLEPLVYHVEGEGEDRKLTPKKPEEILTLKVCDPAMGSGSFLVAALRYMTEALYESLWYHVYTKKNGSIATTIPEGEVSKALFHEDITRYRPDDEKFEEKTKARLKRYVVERCIYGVDINPLAVELAKLSLWVETLDRELPFEFLEHKLKVGNSLVGTWFDRFQDYPVMAWMREGGDKDHKGVHYEKGAWTKKIKEILNKNVKPELIRIIQGVTTIDEFDEKEDKVAELHEKAVALFEELHNLPLFGEGFQDREEFFKEKILNDPELVKLKERFDLWCSIWFWPGDWLDENAPTPDKFFKPTEKLIKKSTDIAQKQKFFHWELEFPDVFISNKCGFDGVVGNPPWDIRKPKSQEFFSKRDPIFRTYNKQNALSEQRRQFSSDKNIELEWIRYFAFFKKMSNWTKNVGFPYGDPDDIQNGGNQLNLLKGKKNDKIYLQWRKKRDRTLSYADSEHPYRYQGSADINSYKMFLEQAHSICRKGGRIGFIVPSGLYVDKGNTKLRELFLNQCNWEWLFSISNRNKIFKIDSTLKFCPIILQKGEKTKSIKVAFMIQNLSAWETPLDHVICYNRDLIRKLSPKSGSIIEIKNKNDLEIIKKIYSYSQLLDDDTLNNWNIEYHSEFHMTNDSHLFPPKSWWEEKGYKPNTYGVWIPPSDSIDLIYRNKEIGKPGDIAFPFYVGKMIEQYNFAANYWLRGTGRASDWQHYEPGFQEIGSPYLMSISQTRIVKEGVAVRHFSNVLNSRSMISAYIPRFPCGNGVPMLFTEDYFQSLILLTILNSYIFDFILRQRLTGINLNWFILKELPLPIIKEDFTNKILGYLSAKLSWTNYIFSRQWLSLKSKLNLKSSSLWKSYWAITSHERLRLRCILDAIVVEQYGLNFEDFVWILRNDTSDPKGFWRVDKDKPQALRHTTLSLVAFRDLKKMIEKNEGDCDKGIKEFCEQNNDEGWMIPETISFIQREKGILEFDTPDSETYEVRSKLGERFLPWQLDGTPEKSWKECEMHARNILGDEEFEKFMKDLEEGNDLTVTDVISKATSKMNKEKTDNDKQKNLLEW